MRRRLLRNVVSWIGWAFCGVVIGAMVTTADTLGRSDDPNPLTVVGMTVAGVGLGAFAWLDARGER